DRRRGFFEMLRFGCANNWSCDRRLVKQPRKRNFRAADSSGLGNLTHMIHDFFVELLSRRVEFFAILVGFSPHSARLSFPWSRKAAARQRAPRQHANAFRQTKR